MASFSVGREPAPAPLSLSAVLPRVWSRLAKPLPLRSGRPWWERPTKGTPLSPAHLQGSGNQELPSPPHPCSSAPRPNPKSPLEAAGTPAWGRTSWAWTAWSVQVEVGTPARLEPTLPSPQSHPHGPREWRGAWGALPPSARVQYSFLGRHPVREATPTPACLVSVLFPPCCGPQPWLDKRRHDL